jgi:DNA (cytosine-5)-methyltransferase 1
MSGRIWIERSDGLQTRRAKAGQVFGYRIFGGGGHPFEDRTLRPFATVTTHPVRYVVEPATSAKPFMPDPSKPPYHVPTLAEIAEIPWNGYTVVSTFAGGGGSSLGYRMAGYRVLLASEFVEAAQEVYRLNAAPYTFVDGRDIRTVAPASILEQIGLKAGELDVLDGSPPCASFSTAGKRHKAWGQVKAYSDTEQRVDDLFFEYARLVEGIQPKVFVAENVSGLVKGTAKGYFLEILRRLRSCGYRVECKLLDAQWLGVPQARQRLIFIGVREDLRLAPAFPKPLHYRYSVHEAIPWLLENQPPASEDDEDAIERGMSIERFAIGDAFDNTEVGGSSDRYFNLRRPDPDEPSPTITAAGGNASAASVVHPTQKRKFSIGELKRICSFPDDYRLTGSYSQQWERLGRAVPPLMMRSIAETVAREILDRAK